MRLIAKLLVLVCLLPLTSCFWGDEYDNEHIVGDFFISGSGGSWGSGPTETVLLYFDDREFGLAEPIIPWKLKAIGFNENLLIVEVISIPKKYYIIPVTAGIDRVTASDRVIGPLDRNAFDKKLQSIKDGSRICFTRRFKKTRSSGI